MFADLLLLQLTMLLREVLLPLAPRVLIVSRNEKKTVTAWAERLANQLHPGFLGGSTCLTAITGYTGTNYIFPSMLSALVSRDDMVQGKLSSFLTTILTGVLVTFENLKSGQLSRRATGTLNHRS